MMVIMGREHAHLWENARDVYGQIGIPAGRV